MSVVMLSKALKTEELVFQHVGGKLTDTYRYNFYNLLGQERVYHIFPPPYLSQKACWMCLNAQ